MDSAGAVGDAASLLPFMAIVPAGNLSYKFDKPREFHKEKMCFD
jgi:hypothetical protein